MKVLIFCLLLLMNLAHASDDVCDVRPDLCRGPAVKRKKRKTNARLEMMRAAKEVESDFEHDFDSPARGRRPAAQRPSQFAPLPSDVTYDFYLHENSAHPAIARRVANMPNNQQAFVTPAARATVTGSTLDQPAPAPAPVPVTGNTGALNRTPGGDAQPSATGVNPGDVPTNAPPDAPSPLH